MAEPNEDIPYNTPSFATPDKKDEQSDPDQPNKSVLLEVQKYLGEAIDEHNTLDTIDLTEVAKITVAQQIAVNKLVVNHLRSIKSEIDSKVEELK